MHGSEKLRRFKFRVSFVLMKTWPPQSQDAGNYRILQRPGFSGFVVVVDDTRRTKQIARFDCQSCNRYSVFVE